MTRCLALIRWVVAPSVRVREMRCCMFNLGEAPAHPSFSCGPCRRGCKAPRWRLKSLASPRKTALQWWAASATRFGATPTLGRRSWAPRAWAFQLRCSCPWTPLFCRSGRLQHPRCCTACLNWWPWLRADCIGIRTQRPVLGSSCLGVARSCPPSHGLVTLGIPKGKRVEFLRHG